MELLIISKSLANQLSSVDELYKWVKESLVETALGNATLPLRQGMQIDADMGTIGMMPGHLKSANAAGVKLVSLVPPHRRRGSSHLGLMVLYDDDGLVPIAILDGAHITAIRTAAASAVATDVLARKDSKTLAILGTGEQAHSHINALMRVRPFKQIMVWGRSLEKAQALCEQLEIQGVSFIPTDRCEVAVSVADVICTVTGSPAPVLPGELVRPGCHVNLVGSSHANACETDTALLLKSDIFLDYEGSARAQAGEILKAVADGDLAWNDIKGEIGHVLTGNIRGRTSSDQITVYKSLGIAAQDIITARRIYDQAITSGLGQVVHL